MSCLHASLVIDIVCRYMEAAELGGVPLVVNTPGDWHKHRGGLLTGVYTGWLTGIGADTLLQTLRIVAPSMIGLLEHEGDELQSITASMKSLTAQVPSSSACCC